MEILSSFEDDRVKNPRPCAFLHTRERKPKTAKLVENQIRRLGGVVDTRSLTDSRTY